MSTKKEKAVIAILIVAIIALSAGIGYMLYYNMPANRLVRSMNLAHDYMADKDWDEAKLQLQKAIEIDPKNVEAYTMLAEIYVQEENYDEAISCYKTVIEIDNSKTDAYLAIAGIYIDREEYEKALDILDEGIKNTDDGTLKEKRDEVQKIIDEIAAKKAEEERLRKEQEEAERLQRERDELIAKYGLGYEIGNIMPDTEIVSVDGERVQLYDFLGKPLYINFFTTWCPYCDKEVGDMQSTYNKYSGQIEFIMVDLAETAAEARAYAKQYGLTIPMYMRNDWTFGDYQVEGVPTTFVLDKDGRIVDMTIGWATASWMTNATKAAISASN